MPAGITGPLLSTGFLERHLFRRFRGRLGEADGRAASARLGRWWRRVHAACGPATSLRTIVSSAAAPLAEALGFEIARTDLHEETAHLTFSTRGFVVPVIVTAWQAPPGGLGRTAARAALLHGSAWCLVFHGPRLRLHDARRVQGQRYLEFDLPLVLEDDMATAVLWALSRPEAFDRSETENGSLLAEIVQAAEQEGMRVCTALRAGVLAAIEQMLTALASDAVRRRRPVVVSDLHAEALTAVYRMLFLLFAEARTLLPSWHPVYRSAYSVETLRRRLERGGPVTGIWESLQAIGRLAHAGCRAGDLVVTPFNGRLFSPAGAPRLDSAGLSDESVAGALLSVSTIGASRGAVRERIAFGDLGVEELGAVYEGLLEYDPRVEQAGGDGGAAPRHSAAGPVAARDPVRAHLERTGTGHRKATGTFYTPRDVTRYLVRQTLEPLVEGRSAAEILELRVCDPAMGSGAFLVAACHFLAEAYEAALVRDGGCAAHDLTDHDRAGFRRLVAQRCLFGVDLNPMAVQLSRLSLWLTTLAAEQPLTFLDHHLVAGNSLLGAGPIDLLLGPGVAVPGGDDRQLPLFDPEDLAGLVGVVLPVRHHLERTPDTTAAVVRDKESALSSLGARADVRRWHAACDVWCANWCMERPHRGATLRALLDAELRGAGRLNGGAARRHLAACRQHAATLGFHHWPLQFPEVFFDDRGGPRPDAGFDAVVGNPPWDMLRSDTAGGTRAVVAATLRFARGSRLYSARPAGHANLYQLFVDRALALVRRGGRLGLVVPGGLSTDASAAELRRRLFRECDLETLVGFENRAGVFPIHRGTRFLLVSAERGRPTERVRCRFGLQDPAGLDDLTARAPGSARETFPVTVTPGLLRRVSGAGLSIPYVRSAEDLRLCERMAEAHPALGSDAGWGVRFGRELNATDHRRFFTTGGGGLPVLEGKHVQPYRVRPAAAALRISSRDVRRLLGDTGGFTRPRLAFRDVSGASNRRTLIAAILPAGCVTTHTLFCLRTPLPLREQRVLCALLNSHVADFLVRLRVTTHVTLAVIHTIPVPRPEPASLLHGALERLASRLESGDEDEATAAQAQALAARAYGLTPDEFAHVLSAFPLVPGGARQAALDAFTRPGRPGSPTR